MRVLHVGCGTDTVHAIFEGWEEVRLDIDPSVKPDIVASITDLGDIGPFDAVYACHVLEHLLPQDGAKALAEFRRVLAVGGFVLIVVPNLKGVVPTEEVLYVAPAGPITGRDMIYGKESLIAKSPYMAHRNGFIPDTLRSALAIFDRVKVDELAGYNLCGVGVKV